MNEGPQNPDRPFVWVQNPATRKWYYWFMPNSCPQRPTELHPTLEAIREAFLRNFYAGSADWFVLPNQLLTQLTQQVKEGHPGLVRDMYVRTQKHPSGEEEAPLVHCTLT